MKILQRILLTISGYSINKKPPKRIFDPTSYDLYKDLQEGDIILNRLSSGNFSGGIICHMTNSPYPHAEIHIRDGYTVSAIPFGVGFVDELEENVKGNLKLDIFRLKKELTREQRLTIQEKALETISFPYDYINLFKFPFLKNEKAVKFSGNKAYICSEHVSWAYHNAGIDLIRNKPEAIEAPADIALSDALEYVGTYEGGNKLPENYKNKFVENEISFMQILSSKFFSLFTKMDEYYEGLKINKSKLLEE